MPSVADAIAGTLADLGTKVFFCVTGGDHGLWIALHDAGIRIINCRSESAAVYMADGYARVSGQPTFVYGQKGPGAANVSSALADAGWAMSPVVSLTSATANRVRERFEYQELDALALHAPLVKWSKAVNVPDRTSQMVNAAVRMALGPPTGPVHLEFPQDVLKCEVSDVSSGSGVDKMFPASRPDPEGISQIISALQRAERPVIVAGKGVMLGNAHGELLRVASALRIPVVTSLGGKGSFPEDHELAVGAAGRYSRRVANDVVALSDMCLVIGTRLGGLVTNEWRLPFEKMRILQIDIDPTVIGWNYPVEIGVVGDAREALAEISRQLGANSAPVGDEAWIADVKLRVSQWSMEAEKATRERPPDGIHPAAVIKAVSDTLVSGDILCCDTGASAAWCSALFPSGNGRRFVRSGGSLGWVIPGAMGAALASPGSKVIALTGDGGLGYHIGEIETALRCGIPFVILVQNNCTFASEYHSQVYNWKRVIPEVDDFYDVDYAAVAASYGAWSRRVDDASEIQDSLTAALDSGRPALLDVRISKEVVAPSGGYDRRLNRRV